MLGTIPLSRLREAGLLDSLLQLAGVARKPPEPGEGAEKGVDRHDGQCGVDHLALGGAGADGRTGHEMTGRNDDASGKRRLGHSDRGPGQDRGKES